MTTPETPSRLGFLALVAALLLVGCTPPASPSEGPSAFSSPMTAADSADTCRPIDIRSPTGERIDLTGTWEGGVFLHHVRQVGDCVWWIGYGQWPGTELGDIATLTFFGRLTSDFRVSGQFAMIIGPAGAAAYYPGPHSGPVSFQIGFDPDSGMVSELTGTGAGETEPKYPTPELRPVGPLPESANPPVQ